MARIRRSPRFSPYLLTVVCLLLVSVCRVATVWAQATLENPAADSYQSGLGLISGWACEAGRIEIEFNHDPRTRQPASYGTPRGDTAGACGDSDNGFGLLINWNLLGDGTHTVRALADGVAFGQATVTVTTLGQEYAQGLRREVPVDGFPRAGQQRTLVWQESQQNFVITAGQPAQGGGTRGTATQQLENPQPGSYQSGLGLISGWVCAAGRIEIEFNGDPHTRQRAGYGTPRGDTAGVCGDSDNGFGLLFNWNLLGNGMHTVRALADGQEFAHSTVTVSTLGQEYAQELSREVTLADFPAVGQTTTLAWQESQQNFAITGSTAGGPVLSIAAPDPVPGFFADVLGILRPVVSYTGEAPLSFTLPTAPPGMEIDARSGTIAWTPPASATGRTFAVMVEAESDELFDRVGFQVSVLRTTPVQTTVANGALTVTDGGTDLHGLRITTPATRLRLSDLRLETVEREAVLATVPAVLTLLSDFFVIREPFAQPVKLTFPVGDLPAGTDIRDVDLYRFGEATGSDGPFWGSVLVDWRYEMVSGEPAYIVSLEGLHGLFVFGLPELVPGGRATSNAAPVGDRRIVTPAVSQSLAATQASVSKVECFPNPWFSLLEPNYRSQTCTYADDPAVEIAVKDFVQLNSNERWGMGIEEFVARVIEIQEELEKLGLAYDKDITIDFDIPLNTSVLDAFTHDRLGEVTCVNWLDRAKTLRIYPANINNATNLDKLPLNDLAVETIAHEYFHHAQCHEGNEMPGLDLAVLQIDGKGSVTSHLLGNYHWLTEGSADWFAHSAVPATRSIRAEILEVGLDSIQDDDDLRKWPYFRAPFFAMLKERCADFSSLLKKILSIDEDSDASGINRLAEVLARSRCTFGALGTDLGAALAEYQITTFDEDQKPSDEQNAFGYHIDLVDGRSYGENYTKDNFNDDVHPISIPLPAVAAGTLYLDIIGITGGAFAAQDTVEVSMASNALEQFASSCSGREMGLLG